MNLFLRCVDHLSVLCGVIAAVLVGVAIVVVSEMVFVRYVLVGSTTWQTDAVIFSLGGAVFIGSAYLLRERAHVSVGIVTDLLPAGARRVLSVVADAAVFGFATVLFWKSLHLTVAAWQGGWVTDSIEEIPLWIPYCAMPLGFGVLALQAVGGALRTLRATH